MPRVAGVLLASLLVATSAAACSGAVTNVGDADAGTSDGGGTQGSDAAAGDDGASGGGSGCTLDDHTTPTSEVSSSGCAVRDRDTSACKADREAQGIEGYWLKFSCRVKLTKITDGGADYVRAEADGRPDVPSNYFATGDPCHEDYTGGIQNPNLISAQTLVIQFPLAPNTTMADQRRTGAVIGLVVDAVPMFGNFAAPGDDIFSEAKTFDRCGAHPQQTGVYHHHTEPLSVSDDDDHFLGVMRDGYPVYGRRDPDGSLPADLDTFGGHTGPTVDSPSTPVYHYHLNKQTSTDPRSAGVEAWFIATGYYRGLPSTCTGCN